MSLRIKVDPSEQQLIDALDSMNDAFFILDKNFRFVRINKMYEKIAGVDPDYSLGKSIWDVFPYAAQSDSPYWIHYHEAIKTKKPTKFLDFNRLNAWVEVTAYPTDEGGLSVFVRDITEKLKAEQALKVSEERFRALVNATSNVIYRMSPDWTEMHQLDGGSFLADTGNADKNWIEKYIPADEQERVWEAINSAIANKSVFELEHRVKQADGTVGWTLSRAIPIFDDTDTIIEWFGTATDVTSRKMADDERRLNLETAHRMELITEQRNALLKINETKEEFIALASHQLRTPATAVKQLTGMLLGDIAGPLNSMQMDMLQKVYISNERGLKIINDLLKTAEIDGNTYKLDLKTYDIVASTKEVIDDLEDTLEQRNQRIWFKSSQKNIQLRMDETNVKLAISNLIENASKYSHPGSEITVSVALIDNAVEISVIDKGVGIDKENRQKIFEKFTRAGNELSDSVTGSGLGLYWVKQIAEMHEGSIELISQPGKGSTFIMKLPATLSAYK
jgi:chemotaxis family two-component system sensor kinase Cph1